VDFIEEGDIIPKPPFASADGGFILCIILLHKYMSYKIEDWDQTKYLPPQTNSTPELDIVKSLRKAWVEVLQTEPSINSLAVLFSQITLECGPNLKYCKNFNIGNIKSLPNDGRYWTAFRCNEILGGVNKYFDPPNPICNFRAFKTSSEGFVDYIKFLAQKKNYAGAWAQVIKGDPNEYAHQLKIAMYYTASLESYTKGVVSIFNRFKAKYGSVDLSTHVPPENDTPIDLTDEERAHIQGMVALSFSTQIQEYFSTARIDDGEETDPTDNTYYTEVPSLWTKVKGIFGGNK